MKRNRVLCFFLGFLAIIVLTGATSISPAAWGYVNGQSMIIYLQAATASERYTCQVGTIQIDIQEQITIENLDAPIETIVLLDNSISIQEDQREIIVSVLRDLVANRMKGEKYTIATIADKVEFLCEQETEYAKLKQVITEITYQSQDTQLTNGLYSLLEHLGQSKDGTLRRIVLISDGTDAIEDGYTHEELNKLIQKVGYPIYTIGCTNAFESEAVELQNLFSLSRINSGTSFRLADVKDTMDIVNAVTEWNSTLRMVLDLPDEVCDGGEKMVRVYAKGGSGTEYILPLTMPFAIVNHTEPPQIQENVAEDDSSMDDAGENYVSDEENTENTKDGGPVILAAVGAVALALVLAFVIALVSFKKKRGTVKVHEEPAVEPTAPAVHSEVLEDADDTPSGLEDSTELFDETVEGTVMLWAPKPELRLVLQDVNNPIRRFETALKGRILVGRDASQCHIVLSTDPTVARKQCEIYLQSDQVMLHNLSTSNITKVDNQRVSEDCPLENGSIITMGRVRMRVEVL